MDAVNNRWTFEDAQAHFSELVRQSQVDGPQLVSVNGDDAVVVLALAKYEQLQAGGGEGSVYEFFASSPLRELEFGEPGIRSPVRDVEL